MNKNNVLKVFRTALSDVYSLICFLNKLISIRIWFVICIHNLKSEIKYKSNFIKKKLFSLT